MTLRERLGLPTPAKVPAPPLVPPAGPAPERVPEWVKRAYENRLPVKVSAR